MTVLTDHATYGTLDGELIKCTRTPAAQGELAAQRHQMMATLQRVEEQTVSSQSGQRFREHEQDTDRCDRKSTTIERRRATLPEELVGKHTTRRDCTRMTQLQRYNPYLGHLTDARTQKDIKLEFLTGQRKFDEIMEKLEIIINEMMGDGPVPMELGSDGTHDAKMTQSDLDTSNDMSYDDVCATAGKGYKAGKRIVGRSRRLHEVLGS